MRGWIHLVVVLAAGAALVHGPLAAASTAPLVRDARPLMGTVVEISAQPDSSVDLPAAIEAAFQEMARLSKMMNHYDPESVVSELNQAAGGGAIPVPSEMMEVLDMAQALSKRTRGAFDVTIGALHGWRFRPGEERVPSSVEIESQRRLVNYSRLALYRSAGTARLLAQGMRVDLGGVAKLYILDAGLRVLAKHKVTRAMVNGGGDIAVMGGTFENPWRIGVRDPRAPERIAGVLPVARGYVTSSGDYERAFVRGGRRYHHILDPRTGYPAEGPHGVTLVSESLDALNGLSVAVMVLGKRAGSRLLIRTPAVEGLIIDRDGSVWMTRGFRARLLPP